MFCVKKVFTFDAAHNLTKYKGKCEKLHGHTYKLEIKVCGDLNDEEMVLDFSDLSTIVEEEIISKLDHSYINDIIPQPTAEMIAKWIWDKLSNRFRTERYKLQEVTVWETPTSCAIYFE
ncbi:MAG: 6-pyruvoyltetrahydropterin/6-carboxytetrahydropterin synthase [Thermotogaceae bacterium]|nr:6-pyruvoyltetrahydropterin/6-carboxytetrahydropterin synthase [Thermotogaceae bacterium]